MRAILFTFLLLIAGVAQAQKTVPSGVDCMKKARGLGLSISDLSDQKFIIPDGALLK